MTVELVDASVPPVITSDGGGTNAALSFAENGTTAITTVVATDADPGQTITYSIDGGADAALFAINPTTGVLTFLAAPDFEVPSDAGADNVYDVIVAATDSAIPSAKDTQALTITVTNVTGADYVGTAAANVATGTIEPETLIGAAGNDALSGLGGNDTINGGADRDTISGGDGDDVLSGNGGDDTIDGGSGADRIIGGAGVDFMTGGAGADVFVFAAPGEAGNATQRDRITDFAVGIDRIDIGAFDANTTVAGVQDFTFLATEGAAFTGSDQLRIRHDVQNNLTFVEGNINGNLATAELQVVLSGIHALTVSDFLL